MASTSSSIITQIDGIQGLSKLLQENQGLLFLKLGAEWCAPCKKIESLVNEYYTKLSCPNVKCALIDVDQNMELYGFLKTKRVVNGIPVILCYLRGNLHYIPDDLVIGANDKEIHLFFHRCIELLRNA